MGNYFTEYPGDLSTINDAMIISVNQITVNNGVGKPFVEKSREVGLGFITISWGANFADFDHDGDLDLFVANGDLNPNCVPMGDYYL